MLAGPCSGGRKLFPTHCNTLPPTSQAETLSQVTSSASLCLPSSPPLKALLSVWVWRKNRRDMTQRWKTLKQDPGEGRRRVSAADTVPCGVYDVDLGPNSSRSLTSQWSLGKLSHLPGLNSHTICKKKAIRIPQWTSMRSKQGSTIKCAALCFPGGGQ